MEENMVLSWDSVIGDGQESQYFLPDAGEWEFCVTKLEKGTFTGTGKIKSCPKATVTLEIVNGEKRCEIKENLLLHTSMEWKLADYFRCLGMKKHGEKLKLDFDGSVGMKGRAKIKHEKWIDKDGNERTSARVDKFLDFDTEKNSLGQEIIFSDNDLPF